MEKQEAQCGLSVQCRVEVQGDDKCDIRANMNQKFIDNDWFPQSVQLDYIVTKRQQYTLQKIFIP